MIILCLVETERSDCAESKVAIHTLMRKKNLTKKYRFFMEKVDFEKNEFGNILLFLEDI